MDIKCPVCSSEDIVESPYLYLANKIYIEEERMYKEIYKTKMCNNCKYIMMFYCLNETKKEMKQ